jgi:zinc/manganese transport system permease protein
VWQGYDAHDPQIYWMSLGFTLIGALIFAMVKGHEAQHPAGGDHRHLVRGRVGGRDSDDEQGDRRGRAPQGHAGRQHPVGAVARGVVTAAIYVVIGVFHFVFRKRFLEISVDAAAAAPWRPVRLWDFLFYASFGLVVTRSVAIAGVLLVFCYLIVPSVAACCSRRASDRAWRSAG